MVGSNGQSSQSLGFTAMMPVRCWGSKQPKVGPCLCTLSPKAGIIYTLIYVLQAPSRHFTCGERQGYLFRLLVLGLLSWGSLYCPCARDYGSLEALLRQLEPGSSNITLPRPALVQEVLNSCCVCGPNLLACTVHGGGSTTEGSHVKTLVLFPDQE